MSISICLTFLRAERTCISGGASSTALQDLVEQSKTQLRTWETTHIALLSNEIDALVSTSIFTIVSSLLGSEGPFFGVFAGLVVSASEALIDCWNAEGSGGKSTSPAAANAVLVVLLVTFVDVLAAADAVVCEDVEAVD